MNSFSLRHFTTLFLASLALGSCARWSSGSHSHSDSGVRGPDYLQIVESHYKLERQNPNWVRVSQYGESTKDALPLVALRLGYQNKRFKSQGFPKGQLRQAVLITGATHGNEFLGFEDKLPGAFMNEIAAGADGIAGGISDWIEQGGLVYMIPIANPTGYNRRKRSNGQTDLNRDFPLSRADHLGNTQIETRNQIAWLNRSLAEDRAELTLTLDYHCCSSNRKPDLLYPWGYSRKEAEVQIPDFLFQHARLLGEIAESVIGAIDFGNTIDVLGYAALGASDDHYFETYTSQRSEEAPGMSFTFEGKRNSKNSDEQKAQELEEHVALWNEWLEELSVQKGQLAQAGSR